MEDKIEKLEHQVKLLSEQVIDLTDMFGVQTQMMIDIMDHVNTLKAYIINGGDIPDDIIWNNDTGFKQ